MSLEAFNITTSNASNTSVSFTPEPVETEGFYNNVVLMKEYIYFYGSAVILCVCTILSVLGNVTVITVVYRKVSLQTVTHLLIVNLAFADLLSSLLCVPFDIAANFNQGSWLPGAVSCKVVRFLYSIFVSASIVTLSAIAIDRYYSVVYPLEKRMTLFKTKLMISYIWIHAVVICLPNLFVYEVTKIPKTDTLICIDIWKSRLQRRIYLILYATLTLFIPLTITCLAYCFVWRAFRLSQRRVNVIKSLKRPKTAMHMPYASKTEMKLLKMLFVMVSVFLLCWGPNVVVVFYLTFLPSVPITQYAILTVQWVTRLNAVLNPIIYGYLNKYFRQGFNDLLRTCPFTCVKALTLVVDISAPPTENKGLSPRARDGTRQRDSVIRTGQGEYSPQNIFVVSKTYSERKPDDDRRKKSSVLKPSCRRITTSEVEVHTVEIPMKNITNNNLKKNKSVRLMTRKKATFESPIVSSSGTESTTEAPHGKSLELPASWTKGYGHRKRLLPPLGMTPENLVEAVKKNKRKKKRKSNDRQKPQTKTNIP
ncbi:putative G-protein coupled receptor 176 [Glandiceps talaboti]